MRKRKGILLAALFVVVLGGLAWVVIPFGSREPVYDGEVLNFWLRQAGRLPRMNSNAVPFLERALETHDGPVKRTYITVEPKMPNWIQNQLPEPVEGFEVRMNAIAALAELGNDARPAIPALIRVLKQDEADLVRSHVADALGKIGKNDRSALDALVEATRDKELGVRLHAVYALGKTGSKEQAVISALDAALEDGNRVVRFQAAVALGSIGQGGQRVKDALVEALKDKDPQARASAAEVLKKFDPEATVKAGAK